MCLWNYSGDQSKWKLIYVDPNTAIGDDVVDDVEGEVVSVTYYTTDGKVSAAPVKGVNIVKSVYANGAVKTKKMIVR